MRVLDRVGFDMAAGDCIGVVGDSGSGKSVMSLSLLRLIPEPPGRIVEGSIEFEGVDLLTLPTAHARHPRQGDRHDLPGADERLNPVMRSANRSRRRSSCMRAPAAAAPRRVLDMLQLVGIPDAASRYASYPHEFSGGMRQRVMIAMALACNPKLLIADEPTTALDVTIQAQVLELMKQLRARYRTSILLICHDLGVIADVADRVIVMYCGRVVEMAEIDDLFDRPLIPTRKACSTRSPAGRSGRTGSTRSRARRPPRRNAGRVVPSIPVALSGCRFAWNSRRRCFRSARPSRPPASRCRRRAHDGAPQRRRAGEGFAARSRWSAFAREKSVVRAVDDLSLEIWPSPKPWRWWASPVAASRRPAA